MEAPNKKKKSIDREDTLQWKSSALEKIFADDIEVAQLDLIDDLNDTFFGTAYDLVQRLAPLNRFVAAKLKCYVDILSRMHTRYAEAVETATNMHTKVRVADEKLKLAIDTTSMSTDMMGKMRESLAEAWRTADAAQYRENLLQNSQQSYTAVDNRTTATDKSSNEQTREMRIRSVVYRERDRLAGELKDYQKRLEQNRSYAQNLEVIIEDLRGTIKKQQLHVQEIAGEMYATEHRYRTVLEALEDNIKTMRKELEQSYQVNKDLQTVEKQLVEALVKNEEMKLQIGKLTHEKFSMVKNTQRLQEDLRRCQKVTKDLEAENKALMRSRDDLNQMNRAAVQEIKKKTDLHSMLERRFHLLAKKNGECAERELLLNNELTVLEKKLMVATANLEDMTRSKEEVERNRERFRVELASLNDDLASLKHDLSVQRSRTQDVQMDLDRCNRAMESKDIVLHKINKEKHDLQVEANGLVKSMESLEEQLEQRTEKLQLVTEQLEQKHQSYLNAKKQMEIVHSAKTVLEKNYQMCVRDRQTQHNLNGKLSFQNNQLCNQLANNEKELAVLKNRIEQLESVVKHKQNEIHSKERQLHRTRVELEEMKIKNGQLQHTTEEDEKRFKQVSISLDEVTKEKTLVGHQMVRRNDELRIQHEKLAMMQLAMVRGDTQYNQRMEDIRLLKTEINNLRMSNGCLQRAVRGTADMRREVVRLERQLVREQLQVAAFTEEMKYPYRIHRWRVLIGRDPSKYQLIRKVQMLLKRNIRLGLQYSNLEQQLQQKQLMYNTLKEQIQHMPDRSIVERLSLQHSINQRQTRKIRAMKAELAINEIDLKSRDLIIDQYQQVIKKEHPHQPPSSLESLMSQAQQKKKDEKFTKHIFDMTSTSSNPSKTSSKSQPHLTCT